ncbi:RagB/SusD family nutrient uptake outer membrane protein [Chitinophaga ginsengisoli]|uniref:SusD-like starch-binding protein associating with outer membrane n=1 Tax=Chitinophaga ginsengisoli TaxID=363837 RepID=A0A2P8GLY4_9BACT|nr:RagB/SusD family nutrient uptake outer membrane protein [Chitinophaga ginsengisoli]PSL34973.1 SusD-like starch-binding protein associating with outer membrane [Chitinophaga ginsengisoli]
MTIKHLYITLLVIAGITTSCRKYVEIEQPNQREFKYTADFQRLLNNVSLFEQSASLTMVSSDDINLDANTSLQGQLMNGLDNIYTWAADYYTSDQGDAGWDQLYKQIYTCNQITANVMESENGTTAEKQKAYAEAQVQRATAYLTLINLYARVYNTANASKDPGVPLLLTPDLFANLTRASVQQVYDQILLDLTQALPVLPDQPSNNLHPAKAAVYAMLSRTYLYMQRYAEAADNAAKALSYQHTLLDLNNYTAGGSAYPRRLLNPEVILSKQAAKPGYLNLPLSDELINRFSTDDLRYKLFTRNGSSFFPSFTGRGSYRDMLFAGDNVSVGVAVPEMMLIQAEGLARNGQKDEAIALVNTLRQKRFSPSTYVALSATTADEALHIVLDERRRELFGTGLRWFDQRRLSVEPALAETESRTFKGTTYTLVPGDRYVYPIPPKNIEQNPEITQNAR